MELVSTPDNPVPEGALVTPVGAVDGVVLRVARWMQPSGVEPRGTVCVFTGRGEFIEKYFETIGELIERQFAVVAMDWRGQGLSGRALDNSRKGHVDDFALFERDLDALTKQVLQFLCPRPFFAIGHSMGGAILLSQAQSGTSPFQRLVVTAPMIDIEGLQPRRLIRGLIEVADIVGLGSTYVPGGRGASSMSAPFETNVLTSDRKRYMRNAAIVAAAPHLGIGDPTFGWLNAAFRLMSLFADPSTAHGPSMPVLAFSAAEDRVVSTPAIHRYIGAYKTSLVVPLAHARHEILQETDSIRAQFWAAFDAFIPGQTDESMALAGAVEALQNRRNENLALTWLRRVGRRAPARTDH
jgi:lysophospholipase